MTQIDFAAVEIVPEVLAPGIAALYGLGGNMSVFHGADGTLLIDTQFASLTPKIEAAIASLGGGRVNYVFNTHWHFDHSGGNENFGCQGATIFAHERVRDRMISGGVTTGIPVAPSPAKALPAFTFADSFVLHLNDEEVQLLHMRNGHTDGDSIVWWMRANVVHLADLFVNRVSLPHIDASSGGTAPGMLEAVNRVLAMVDSKTKIVPGHGAVGNRDDLVVYRDILEDIIDVVSRGKERGMTLAEVIAARPADRHNIWKPAYIDPDYLVDAVYRTLDGPVA